MKKLTLLCLFFALFAIHKAHAQPTFYIDLPEVTVDPGDQFCVQVRFEDFTNIIELNFSLAYDPTVIGNPSVTPVSLGPLVPNYSTDNIDWLSTPGIITFEWDDGQPCTTMTGGATIPDFEQLFEVCFEAVGIYGNHTPICFVDDPVDQLVRRSSANCTDIGEFTRCGYVSLGTESLSVNISSGDGYQGDIVCLDFEVEDFDDIVSFQYGIFWDNEVLEYISATPSNLQEFNLANIGQSQAGDGILNLSWWTTSDGVNVPDGTNILQVCYEILGECGDQTEVFIAANSPAPIEVINGTSAGGTVGTNIGLLQTSGEVSVNCFDPNSITVSIEDKEVCPGESFTVDVEVEDFDDITQLQFNLKWNPSVISLNNSPSNGVSYPDGTGCFLFGTGSTVDINPTLGLIEVDWGNGTGFGCDLSDGHRLMRLHFTAVGSSGTNSTISIINPIFVDEFGGQSTNIGINNNNGLVEICELNSPTIAASSATVDAGEQVCIEFNVQDFEDILRTQYTISWEPTILSYVGPQAFNLPGLGSFNFLDDQTNQGFLGVEWENSSVVTVPDGSSIFEICFDVIGDPDECSPIEFGEIPWVYDIETGESGGTNVGLNGQPGQVCIENPLDFFVSLTDIFGSPGAEVCLDVTAEGFNQLTKMDYSLNWDTDIIQYERVEITGGLPDFTTMSYDESAAFVDNGQLPIHWESSNALQGTTLPDGTALFQVCFTVLGNDGECSGVSVSGEPHDIVINTAPTGPSNLGMTAQPGSVCVNASIDIISALVVDVDCPSFPTGAIDLTMSGGSGAYIFEWTGFNVNPITEDQNSLYPGNYFVTVTDAANPGLVAEMEITVGLVADAPIANAGLDTTRNCTSQGLILDGGASSTGSNLSYQWTSDGSLGFPGSIDPETDTTMFPFVFGGQYYILTVTNELTGCADQDTVVVSQPVTVVPSIDVAALEMLTCVTDTIMLQGSDPFNFDVAWSTPSGNIVSGTANETQALVTEPGWYYLTYSNFATECHSTDSVLVEQDLEEPVAVAGDDGLIGCQDVEAPLDGSMSSAGMEYTYFWSAVGTGEICDDETGMNTTVCSPGIYELLVTNEINGCTAIDIVEVVGDTSKPEALAGPDLNLDCLITEVTLDGSGSTQGSEIVYTWTDESMTFLGNGQTLIVNEPGTYTLEVMDTDNDCSAISEVTVDSIAADIDVDAIASNDISCNVMDALLDWGNSAVGPEYSYEWQDPSGAPIGDVDSIMVSIPGEYALIIFNSENQCQDTAKVLVADLTASPAVEAGDQTSIGCVDDIPLQGTVDMSNQNLIFQWQGPGAGCINNGTTLNPDVECAGVYTLVVVDTLTGCSGMDAVEVVFNQAEPGALAEAPNSVFPCDQDEMILTGSSDSTDVEIMWTSVPSFPISGETTLSPTITEPAFYTLTITGTNGCTSSFSVNIEEPVGPIADAGMNDSVDCLDTEAVLSAANSTLDNTTLTWEALSGDDPTNPNDVEITVGAGEYQLTVIDQNGCSAVDVVIVDQNGDLPAVEAGDPIEKACDEDFVELNGVAEAGLTYTWRDESGMIVGSDLSLQVTQAGTYTLTVINTANSCENSDTAIVTLAEAGEEAIASFDHDACDPEAMLMGNLPTGATGVWAPITGGTIEDPTAETTLASGFAEGENQFTWTLSLGTCLDYSTDTATILLDQSVPDAVADFAIVDEQSAGEVTINVLENDIFNPDMTTIALMPNGVLNGSATMTEDGTITYNKDKCFVGTVNLPYELCNTTCPDLCDQATLTIDVQLDESENCDEVPNAITPNDDGVNDVLVFDVLLANPDAPDNEILIFNRWGDVVYQAKPYLNDWGGTNDSGKDLPQGTYYYVLKMDIANGEIIRGDMTILK